MGLRSFFRAAFNGTAQFGSSIEPNPEIDGYEPAQPGETDEQRVLRKLGRNFQKCCNQATRSQQQQGRHHGSHEPSISDPTRAERTEITSCGLGRLLTLDRE